MNTLLFVNANIGFSENLFLVTNANVVAQCSKTTSMLGRNASL